MHSTNSFAHSCSPSVECTLSHSRVHSLINEKFLHCTDILVLCLLAVFFSSLRNFIYNTNLHANRFSSFMYESLRSIITTIVAAVAAVEWQQQQQQPQRQRARLRRQLMLKDLWLKWPFQMLIQKMLFLFFLLLILFSAQL